MTQNLNGEYDEDINSVLAPLSEDQNWVPAIETFGEGVFISFKNSTLEQWAEISEVKERYLEHQKALEIWNKNSFQTKILPPVEYLLLPF